MCGREENCNDRRTHLSSRQKRPSGGKKDGGLRSFSLPVVCESEEGESESVFPSLPCVGSSLAHASSFSLPDTRPCVSLLLAR